MNKREALYHHNYSMRKLSTRGNVRFALVYDRKGKAHDCWDTPFINVPFQERLNNKSEIKININNIRTRLCTFSRRTIL